MTSTFTVCPPSRTDLDHDPGRRCAVLQEPVLTAPEPQHPLGPTVRPIAGPHEVESFNAFPYPLNDEITRDLATGRRRPEWLWVALHRGRVVARAVLWSRPCGERPLLLDVFDAAAGHEAAARALLRTGLDTLVPPGAKPPQYLRMFPGDWREDHELRPRVESLAAVIEGPGRAPSPSWSGCARSVTGARPWRRRTAGCPSGRWPDAGNRSG